MTQTQLANAANLSQAHICKLENGRTDSTITTLAAIAQAINCDVKDLLTE